MESSEFRATGTGQQSQEKMKKVGHSKFYDVSTCVVASEKQDIMKPEDYLEEGEVNSALYYLIHHSSYINPQV